MKKIRFTVMDAIIIVAVIAVLAVGAKLLGIKSASGGEAKEIYFTVLANKTDEGISKLIQEGDRVSISFSEEAYATVVGVSEEPAEEEEYFQPKGFYMTHRIEGKSDVTVLLKCDAQVTDTKISNGKVPIRVGEEMPVCGKGYVVKGYCIEIED